VSERPLQTDGPAVGDLVELEVGPVAHGGHCVARLEGQVVFVRHALPGERVRARITEGGTGRSFLRADAVEVLTGSPHRVLPPCRYAGSCGGCDFQHVSLDEQRRLKAAVVDEQFRRLARVDLASLGLTPTVEPVAGDRDGLGWRTRVQFAVDGDGRVGLRRHRSHEVVPIDRCLIAAPGVTGAAVTQRSWPGVDALDVVETSLGEVVVNVVPSGSGRGATPDGPQITERVDIDGAEHELALDASGFWQVHPGAAVLLVDTVLGMLDPQPGERAVDLYAGVGLFAVALAERVGPLGQVLAVESDRRATAYARDNLSGHRQALVLDGRVDDLLGVPRHERGGGTRGRRRPRRPARSPLVPHAADLVVLDPPRIGAGSGVVREVAAWGPRAVAYVACDPAALARDTATFVETGYALAGLRCFDAFPMTHHVESVALLVRD
jgi:tRNA/tmRNA/rRNA uracil-C5-methylase (TrmA/RlmC/RlmD family)